MKHDARDGFVLLGIITILGVSLLATCALIPPVVPRLGHFSLAVLVPAFFLSYGLTSVLYLKLLDRLLPLKPGEYDMDHVQFTLWKHHAVIRDLACSALRHFVPVFLETAYHRLLGVRADSNVTVSDGAQLLDPFMIELGDSVIVGKNAVLTGHTMVAGRFYLKRVVVGRGATVGIGAVLMPGTEVGEGAVVAPGAVVTMGTRIPAGEFWGGVPAKRINGTGPERKPRAYVHSMPVPLQLS
jgi:acetyltransferase-like isoleucine patch superfamily enzyme